MWSPRCWVVGEIWHVLFSLNNKHITVCASWTSHVVSLISVLCHAVYYLVIHLWVFCCCVFVPFLVVSGKLKCHPSPIHRPDRDRKLSQPPSILLLSPLHPPISTHVSVVMGNSDKRTLMGKNMLSLGLQGKAASFHSIIFPLFVHYQTPHLIHGQIMSVFQMTAFRLLSSCTAQPSYKWIKMLGDLIYLRAYP